MSVDVNHVCHFAFDMKSTPCDHTSAPKKYSGLMYIIGMGWRDDTMIIGYPNPIYLCNKHKLELEDRDMKFDELA